MRLNRKISMDTQTVKILCRRCKRKLVQDATLCPYCKSEQNPKWWSWSNVKVITSILAVVISIAMVILAFAQLKMASQERADAKEAVEVVSNLEEVTAKWAEDIKQFQSALLS